MSRTKPKPQVNEVLGLIAPVVTKGPEFKVNAWRDTDKPKGARKYHVVVKPRGQAEHDFFNMTLASIKDLGDQLLALHKQLTAPDESTQKLP